MTKEKALRLLKNTQTQIIYLHKHKRDDLYDPDELEALNMAISALEQEPKTGYWIEHEIEGIIRYLECSNCHYETYNVKHNYCMNCGIKMEVKEKSCSNCKFWRLDKNDENRRCRYCYHQDEWQAESEV